MNVYVDDKGSRVVVSCGISNGNAYMVCRVKRSGSLQRIKSKFLPVRNKRKEAQEDLERYAGERGWQKETTDFTDCTDQKKMGTTEHTEHTEKPRLKKRGTTDCTDCTDQKKSTPSGFACHPSRGELEHTENAPPRGRMKKGTTAKETHAQNTMVVVNNSPGVAIAGGDAFSSIVVSNSRNTYINTYIATGRLEIRGRRSGL